MSSLEDTIEEKAKKQTFITLKALDRMCRGHRCTKAEEAQCVYREHIFTGVLDLASKGFTVAEVQCQSGSPVNRSDIDQWEIVCAHCIKHLGIHEKQSCQHRNSAEKAIHLLKIQGFHVKRILCQFNPFRND